MPWSVHKSDKCPAGKEWGVFNAKTGKLHGCHETKEDARKQQEALYANVPESRDGAPQGQYEVTRSPRCGPETPWAVVGDDGKVMGCHDSRESAVAQMTALNSNSVGPGFKQDPGI